MTLYAYLDAVENASGPLLVEIDKTPGSALGIELSQSTYQSKPCVCVESVRAMSVADRYFLTLFWFFLLHS